MDALDSDDKLLRTRSGKVASRDIVQFVPFRDFKTKHYSELARATLAGQFAFPIYKILLNVDSS